VRLNLRIGLLKRLEVTREFAGFSWELANRSRRTSSQQDHKHHKNRRSHGAYLLSIKLVVLLTGIVCGESFSNVLASAPWRLLRILANKLAHACDAVANGVVGCSVAEADVLAFVRYALAEVNVGQHRHAGLI